MESYNLKKETCISPSQFVSQVKLKKDKTNLKKIKITMSLLKMELLISLVKKQSQKQFGVIIA